ncbi:MAG: hypothetical protein C4519_26955 [Desulfobacteraceae bacterium]|nr:MAG: hypothetical protein C4519_26955 [Desulfobacteraceae bacterium]
MRTFFLCADRCRNRIYAVDNEFSIFSVDGTIWCFKKNLSSIQWLKRAHEALYEQVETIPEECLTNAEAIKWYAGPVWRLSMDDGYSHPLSHFAECYARRGEEQQAIQIRKEAVQSRRQFEKSVEERG